MIKSIKIPAGKRTYFVDVNKTRDGGKYLNISESKRVDNGAYERHGIMVFEDHLNEFVEALREVLPLFSSYKKRQDNNPVNS